jgi:hypothetical protein
MVRVAQDGHVDSPSEAVGSPHLACSRHHGRSRACFVGWHVVNGRTAAAETIRCHRSLHLTEFDLRLIAYCFYLFPDICLARCPNSS